MSHKLRSSCDACNQAKVKCTKTRPMCARCAKHGDSDCVYGISLRAGKRRSHGVADMTSKSVEASPVNTPDENDWSFDPSDLMTLEPELYSTLFGYDTPPPSHDAFSMNDGPYQQALPDPSIGSFALPRQRDAARIMSPTSSGLESSPQFRSFSSISEATSCNCFSTVFLTLNTLHQLSESEHTTFDVALARNKEAVALCLNTLKCGCSNDSTFVMMIASLITKIISIYQLPSNPSTASGTTLGRDSTPTTARLTLGAYNLDQEDEERFKMEIVRVELKKVELLVSRLKEKFCQAHPEYEMRAYEALVVFLSGKLRSALEMLMVK